MNKDKRFKDMTDPIEVSNNNYMSAEEGKENWKLLISAIIEQSYKDYKKSLEELEKNPKSLKWLRVKADCEKFVKTEWYKSMTNIDGEKMLELIRLEQEAQE